MRFMRLFASALENIAFGAVETVYKDGAVTFYKTTEKQRQGWKSINDSLYARAQAATGVRLDFHTDSKTFAFCAKSGRKFDLLLDGVLTYSLSEDDFDKQGRSRTFDIGRTAVTVNAPCPDGTNHGGADMRVTLIFPSHDEQTAIEYVELEDGAAVTPHEYSCKMLFIGDSITQGWNSGFDSLSYAWQTALHFNADCVINGVGGGFFSECTFDKPGFDPDIVIIAYGTNDFGRYASVDEFSPHVNGYLELVKEAYGDKKVFCILPIWRSDIDKYPKYSSFADCCGIIRDAALKRGIKPIDGMKLVAHFKEFFFDHVHPNALGFCMYAKALSVEIEKEIGEKA